MYMFKSRITFRPKITPLQGKELYQFMKEAVGMDGNWFFLLGQPEATVLSVYDCYAWHKWMYAWHNENKHYEAVIRARMYSRQQVLLEEASKIKDIRSFIKLILKRENQILSDYKIDSLINIYNRTRGRVYENFDRENNNLSSREDSSINPFIEKEKEIAEEIFREINNGKLAENKISEKISEKLEKISFREKWQKDYAIKRIREKILFLLALTKKTEKNLKIIARARRLNPKEKKRVKVASLALKIALCVNAIIFLSPILIGKHYFQSFVLHLGPVISIFYNLSIPAILAIFLILSIDLYKKWYVVLPIFIIISPFISGWMGTGGWLFGMFLCISILVDARKRIKISSDGN